MLWMDDMRDSTDSNSFVFTFIILHVMVFTFGMMNYGLKVWLPTYSGALALTPHRTAP